MKTLRTLILVLCMLFLVSLSVSAVTSVTINPASPKDSDNLNCVLGGVSPGQLNQYTFLWYNNGHQDNTIGNTNVYPASKTKVNDYIVCAVFAPGNFFAGTASATVSQDPIIIIQNHPPTVSIITPISGSNFTILTNIFFNSVANDVDGDPLYFTWNFGDGFQVSGYNLLSTNHAYSLNYKYTVVLTVSDGKAFATSSIIVNIVNPVQNQNPVAIIEAPLTAVAGVPLDIFGNKSFDPDGYIVNYSWSFGDGNTSTSSVVDHNYERAGTYVVTLNVTDNQGATGINTTIITIQEPNQGGNGTNNTGTNQPPVANITADKTTIYPNEFINFDGSQSFDPDGYIVNYSWSFGDGNTSTSSVVDHNYERAGTYVVTLTVTDNSSENSSDTMVIIVQKPNQGGGNGTNNLKTGYYKQRSNHLNNGELRDIRIGNFIPLYYKFSYSKGETIPFLVKLVNEGTSDEVVDLKLNILNVNKVYVIKDINLAANQVKWLTVNLEIPSYTPSGLYIAKLEFLNNDELTDNSARSYFNLIVN